MVVTEKVIFNFHFFLFPVSNLRFLKVPKFGKGGMRELGITKLLQIFQKQLSNVMKPDIFLCVGIK